MSFLEVIKETNINDIENNKRSPQRHSVKDRALNTKKVTYKRDKIPQSTIQQIFSKTRVNLLLPNEDKLANYIKEDIDSNYITVKNPYSLYNYLITIPSFRQYIKIYNFKSQTIIDSFHFARYVKLKKNFKLFNQGEKTDFFYLIISGNIGFTLNALTLKSTGPKEVNSLRAGSYFGEWGFIFKISRTVSAYAKEDTLLLKFDKYCFKSYYQHNIINSENKAKKFVLNHINTFKKLGISAFNLYYREMQKIYLQHGNYIFKKGEKANFFYLIFSGCCGVKNGDKNLIYKDVGDFFGIECLFNNKYENTIYINSEDAVIFKFPINIFEPIVLENLRNEFLKYYENQQNLLEVWEKNYTKYKNKYKMNFFNIMQNIKKNKEKNNNLLIGMSLNEMASNSKNKNKKYRYASPTKIKINFNSSTFNNNINKSQSIKLKTPNSSINNRKKILENDSKKVYIFEQLSKSPGSNKGVKLDIREQLKLKEKERIHSFREKYKLKLKQKHSYSYFMEEMDEALPTYKKINLDNHFSLQNFNLKRKRINSTFIQKKLKRLNNIKNKNQPINLNLKKHYINEEKFGKAMKLLFDDFYKKERRKKQQNINNLIDDEKIQNVDDNIGKPIIIIRNYSNLCE